MQTNSKFTQILLIIIAIVLAIIAIFLVKNNQSNYFTTDSNSDVQEKVIKNNLRTYSNSFGKFSYSNSAKIIPSNNQEVINVGVDGNDQNLETVEFISDMSGMDITPYLDNAQYKKETHGNNTFEVFESIEGKYYKHYVLIDGNKSISIFSQGGDSKYIDLSTVSFTK